MKTTWLALGLAVVGLLVLWRLDSVSVSSATARAENPPPNGPQLEPVEDEMHEFMEYVFEPTYQRLKASMAEPPQENGTWKAIKSDALILAEGGNLLLVRTPKQDANAWISQASQVRKWGGELYRSAKKKDYKVARKSYTSMLTECNRCHQKFAEGEHQLQP